MISALYDSNISPHNFHVFVSLFRKFIKLSLSLCFFFFFFILPPIFLLSLSLLPNKKNTVLHYYYLSSKSFPLFFLFHDSFPSFRSLIRSIAQASLKLSLSIIDSLSPSLVAMAIPATPLIPLSLVP
ncbi:hypothetical protein MtrunA17_Chr4g0058181 [Medicago truncatula]|uniref:Transmembrane protein n=1 Tax=Medicago truncatula TaxID=3880 RepID=A0A396ICZ4_MEDTR|nr:hypothetical protein MtrunA17_Chr4g0058181 [Medicago truncatula]